MLLFIILLDECPIFTRYLIYGCGFPSCVMRKSIPRGIDVGPKFHRP